MLRDGELDAVIVGNEVPDDPSLRTGVPRSRSVGRSVLAAARLRAGQPSGDRPARPGASGARI